MVGQRQTDDGGDVRLGGEPPAPVEPPQTGHRRTTEQQRVPRGDGRQFGDVGALREAAEQFHRTAAKRGWLLRRLDDPPQQSRVPVPRRRRERGLGHEGWFGGDQGAEPPLRQGFQRRPRLGEFTQRSGHDLGPAGTEQVDEVRADQRGSQQSGVQSLPGQPQRLRLQYRFAGGGQLGHQWRQVVRPGRAGLPYGLVQQLARWLGPEHRRFVEQLRAQPRDPYTYRQFGRAPGRPGPLAEVRPQALVKSRKQERCLRWSRDGFGQRLGEVGQFESVGGTAGREPLGEQCQTQLPQAWVLVPDETYRALEGLVVQVGRHRRIVGAVRRSGSDGRLPGGVVVPMVVARGLGLGRWEGWLMEGLRVAVAGGGLGGLCLAQGLRRAGVDVTVYEWDVALSGRRQGYRLHMDARAGLALQACLPPELWELFLATCGRPSRRFTVLSDRLRVLHEVAADPALDPFAPETLSTSVNRQTLREILAAGLDAVSYTIGYESGADGVRLRFADGRYADADLLVGADGVNSVVRRQLLPDAEVVDTGTRCVYGRTALTEAVRAVLPPTLLEGFTAVVGGRVGMATALVCLRQRPEQVAASIAPGARLTPVEDYLMWSVTADGDRFGVPEAELRAADPAALHALAGTLIRRWHPDLRELVARATVDETFLIRIRTSVPVPAWQPGRVTLLGDAIHAMSPAGGSGANTALQDAALLCRTLAEDAPDGHSARTLSTAVGAYETRMREYGFAAVEASRRAEAATGARGSGLLFRLFRHLGGRRAG